MIDSEIRGNEKRGWQRWRHMPTFEAAELATSDLAAAADLEGSRQISLCEAAADPQVAQDTREDDPNQFRLSFSRIGGALWKFQF